MPALEIQTEACIVSRTEAGEKTRGFALLSAEHGLLRVYQRNKKSKLGEASLDLFDDLWVSLEKGDGNNVWFLREHRVLRRRSGIGNGGYESLHTACRIGEIAVRNAVDAHTGPELSLLVTRTLDALDRRAGSPEIVYLKFLYSYARDEGYPVRAHWHAGMPPSRREQADTLLGSPLAELGHDEQTSLVARDLCERLEHFLRDHTELHMPLQSKKPGA